MYVGCFQGRALQEDWFGRVLAMDVRIHMENVSLKR